MSPVTEDGRFTDALSSIAIFGGGRIDPLDPDPEAITIEAIAHSLSQQCRWTGHTAEFYSVAEHCVLASRITPTLQCLLHDASEAFLSDLARPVKKASGLGTIYQQVEMGLEQAIATKFRLDWPWDKEVKRADEAMLQREGQQLIPLMALHMPPPPGGTPHVRCWVPKEAEARFLDRYAWLSKAGN